MKFHNESGKLSEEQIRPKELMRGQRKAMLTDVDRLLSRRKDFIPVFCPACEGKDHDYTFEKRGITYVTCGKCGTLFVNPRPSLAVLDWFYRGSLNYAYWNKVVFPSSEQARRERIMVPRANQVLEICNQFRVRTGSLLEVGAGFGTFCQELQSRNLFKRIVAVEPTPDLANTCRNKGIETIELPIEKILFEASDLFDVIVNFEVIEHLFSPRSFLDQIRKVLRPGGLLILSCPNGEGFDIKTLCAISDTIDHEHLNYFNARSISIMAEASRFQVLDIFTPGKLDAELVRNKILDGEYRLTNQPFLERVLIDDWDRLGQPFQTFLAENGLSSNMWMVARKV
jgi:SAM-dependent methyltransferase